MIKKKNYKYFKEILNSLAKKSSCNRAKVASIIVKDEYIISTGYNGSPRKIKSCNEIGHVMKNNHCIATIHAEQNAIINAAKLGISINNSDMISTHKPCFKCMQILINSGIKNLYYFKDYNDEFQYLYKKNKFINFIKIK